MLKGIDVSPFQKVIDWSKVKASGINFAYIKASEGCSYAYKVANAQALGAKGQGILIGYYHFANVGYNAPEAEANFFHAAMQNLPKMDTLPVLDIETNKKNLSQNEFTAWTVAFVKRLRALGYKDVVIYSYTAFLTQYLLPSPDLATCPLWVAQYTTAPAPRLPKPWTKYAIWQYSNKGDVPGIGQCDVNKSDKLP